MAPKLADAEAMLAAARASGKVAVLGYNYIQNPVDPAYPEAARRGRHRRGQPCPHRDGRGLHGRSRGAVPAAPRGGQRLWRARRFRRASAVADLHAVRRRRARHVRHGQALSDAHDAGAASARSRSTTSPRSCCGSRTARRASSRSAAPPGAARAASPSRSSARKGSILYDQERMNEFQLYLTADRPTEQGFRTVLTAPHHQPYDRFIPAPGHGLGFNDLKIIECRQLIGRMRGEAARGDRLRGRHPDRAHRRRDGALVQEGRWVEVGSSGVTRRSQRIEPGLRRPH